MLLSPLTCSYVNRKLISICSRSLTSSSPQTMLTAELYFQIGKDPDVRLEALFVMGEKMAKDVGVAVLT